MLDIIINPFVTILLFLYRILGGNVVLAIVVFTILVRLATFPLTLKQQRSSKAMQELQPELKKLQEKYKNDKERLAQAQMELYREFGFNPLAGCLPLVIQLPIMLGLYRAIITTLAATPLELLNLSGRLWVADLSNQVPLQNKFLWLNLAVPDPLYLLPVLVVVTTWLQQKLLMPATPASNSGDNKSTDQASQVSRQMMTIMPLMFGFFSLSFASGLSVYFIASNLIGIGQYALTGKINLPGRQAAESEKSPKVAEKGDVIETAPAKAKRDQVEPAPKAKPEQKPKRGAPVKAKRAGGVYDSRAERARAKSKAKG